MEIHYTGVYAYFVVCGIQNRHDGRYLHLRGDNGPENVEEAATRNGVPEKMMEEVREKDQNWDA